MSVISSTHSFNQFVSGVSAPADSTQRLVKIVFKQTEAMTKKGLKAPESSCVSVPKVEELTQAQMEGLQSHVFKLLEDAQDGIIRELYLEGKSNVQDAEISVESCIAYLNEQAQGSRITKEVISQWCEDSGFADMLRMKFAAVLGLGDDCTDEEAAKVEMQVAGYTEKFCALAGSKTSYTADVAAKLLKAIQLHAIQDEMSKRFSTRLQDMVSNPKSSLELLGL